MATLDDLSQMISDMVEDYVEEIIPKLDQRLIYTADEIINYIKTNAPRSGSKNAFADTSIVHPFMCVITRTIVQQNAVIVALYL